MNEKDIRDLVDRSNRAAFLLGKVTGGISTVLQAFNNNLVIEAEHQLRSVFKDLMDSIDDIYYKVKE